MKKTVVVPYVLVSSTILPIGYSVMIVINGCMVNVLESLHLSNGENMKPKIFIAASVNSINAES